MNFKFYILTHLLFFSLFLLKSCQNQPKKEISQPKKVVFDDFNGFPVNPFCQIDFEATTIENQNKLIDEGFALIDIGKYERHSDSTVIFINDNFNSFTVYLKSQKYLTNYDLLYDLIKFKSSQFLGSKLFAEFNFRLNSSNFSIIIFKSNQFIRLKYEVIKST